MTFVTLENTTKGVTRTDILAPEYYHKELTGQHRYKQKEFLN
jgi:hypothetical protein